MCGAHKWPPGGGLGGDRAEKKKGKARLGPSFSSSKEPRKLGRLLIVGGSVDQLNTLEFDG